MDAMGSKVRARDTVSAAGVPIVPGTPPINDPKEGEAFVKKVGLPVLVKAAAGGGGIGMKVVERLEELLPAIETCQSTAKQAFGDDTIFIEKYVAEPRHIEIQVIADKHGNYRHLGERECSIQRRHQKVLEESPSPVITPELRERMGSAAVEAARACGYFNAGTIEFIFSHGDFYFLEMNTRLQVEHPVTEMVTGIDLVRTQIRVAQGERSASPRTTSSRTAGPSSSASTPRTRPRASCPRPAGSAGTTSPAAPACASIRGSTPGTPSRRTTTP